MSRTDIKKLQQEGHLDEALEMAMTQYAQFPQASWAKGDLARVYDAICKKAASDGDLPAFSQAFNSLSRLDVLATDQMLSETLCWRFRSLLSACSSKMEESAKPAFAQQVWEMAQMLGHPHPSESYSVLCKAFYHLRENWTGFLDFMEWWGWQTFRSEDYLQEKLPNGKLMPLSLAEGCYIAYAKLLLQVGDKDRITSFLPRLESLSEAYPAMLYPGYYTGKLLVSIGGDKQAMLQSVLPFVRRKSGEFWAWQLLAEVMHDDESMHISCLLRAVSCKTQDSFLVKVLFHLTTLCLSRRDYVAARAFLQRYVAAKTAAQSRMPADVYHWLNEPWYSDGRIDQSASPILQMDYLDATDGLLYADIPERPICVVRYVPETRMATVIYGYQERGLIKLPKSMKDIGAGSLLLARLQQPSQTGERLSSYTIRKSRWEELTASQFLKEIEGKITSNKSMTVFFVQFGREFAFVPNELYKKRPLVVGERMTARIVWDYQKNKECWSWRCISIQEKT